MKTLTEMFHESLKNSLIGIWYKYMLWNRHDISMSCHTLKEKFHSISFPLESFFFKLGLVSWTISPNSFNRKSWFWFVVMCLAKEYFKTLPGFFQDLAYFSKLTRRKKSPYSELFSSALFPNFSAFGLNMERYGVIREKCGPE